MITPAQSKQLHSLLTQANLMPQKANLILGYTQGRTESSKELTAQECQQLCQYLQGQILSKKNDPATIRMRGHITAMAHELGWIINNDYSKLNNWMLERSYLKKCIFDYTYQELPKLVAQFKLMYKGYLKEI